MSTKFEALGTPNAVRATLRRLLQLKVQAPYSLEDMAQDAVGLLDALEVRRAHIVGASMGGMIAQILAARHADRVESLTLIMSSPGAPQPWDTTAAARWVLLARSPPGATLEELIDMRVRTYQVIGGVNQSATREQMAELARRVVERSSDSSGSRRQLVATQKSGSLRRLCRTIQAPTLVLHGTARAHRRQRTAIARWDGHNLPRPLLLAIAAAIVRNCARARR